MPVCCTEKTEADADRERSLIDQWVVLTEERNAVLVPAAGSGIPGAPADWWVLGIRLSTTYTVSESVIIFVYKDIGIILTVASFIVTGTPLWVWKNTFLLYSWT